MRESKSSRMHFGQKAKRWKKQKDIYEVASFYKTPLPISLSLPLSLTSNYTYISLVPFVFQHVSVLFIFTIFFFRL